MANELDKSGVSVGIKEVFESQKQQALEARKEPISRRKERLKKIQSWILKNRTQIQEAIYADFNKPALEVDGTEIFPALTEVSVALSHLKTWTKPRKIDAPLTMLGTRSTVQYEPRGVCLIIAPWNYPFNLCIGPLVSALSAGNCVCIKPSEITPSTSSLIKEMCTELFDVKEVAVFEGGPEVSQHLLSLPFDHIFFTGSPAIGKVVMRAAAEHLTSVTLELGGKSPVIVTPDANLEDTATRIAVAKFINNGQTCIAPDYILVHQSIAKELTHRLKEKTIQLFSEPGKPLRQSPHYARIVSDKHYARIMDIISDAVEHGAVMHLTPDYDASSRFIHPILLSNVPTDSRVMEEEIFGPVLPILEFTNLEEAIRLINNRPKPLALYVFSRNKTEAYRIVRETSSGSVCINDCAIQFLHHNLPFGGVNNSGIGKAHGYYGFLAFSNEKPVLKQRSGLTSIKPLYPPYTSRAKKLMDLLLKMI
jgi:aldehyde dehydrogenase (NAD+)